MPDKGMRPSIGNPLTRPQYERLNLPLAEQMEFWRIALRSGADWATMRIWSHILFYNTYEGKA